MPGSRLAECHMPCDEGEWSGHDGYVGYRVAPIAVVTVMGFVPVRMMCLAGWLPCTHRHNYTNSSEGAAADGILGGVDVNCGGTYGGELCVDDMIIILGRASTASSATKSISCFCPGR